MTSEERNIKLKHFITCMKCEVSGRVCDASCPTQYEAGNMGEIIENLEAISEILEHGRMEVGEMTGEEINILQDIVDIYEKEDMYPVLKDFQIHALKKAIKELEQQPCEDCISRQAVLNTLDKMDKALDDDRTVESYKELLTECYKDLTPVMPKEEIIHCKDCKYRDYWGECNKWAKELDAHRTYLLNENMFCGFAERRNKDG